MLQIVTSTSASARLSAAARFLQGHPPSTEILLVGASRGAADDLARLLARRVGATFGLIRFSLTELAARVAASRIANGGRTPGTHAAAEAMAARAAFGAIEAGQLAYFNPVARMPGFPKALARTIHELRLAGVRVSDLMRPGLPGVTLSRTGQATAGPEAAGIDLGHLVARVEAELERAAIDDRAALVSAAATAWRSGDVRWAGLPTVLLDVTIDSRSEREFVAAVIACAPSALATIPDGDGRARAALLAMGGALDEQPDAAEGSTDLAHLRRYVFTSERPPLRERAGDVRMFSAPGEGRETVEIVRRALDEAARGVPFDDMAIFLRTPQQYLGLLEHAAARGGVPVYFDCGTRRPDPAGRAFIALLSCGVEGLSARRFDEYLSLGQVPKLDQRNLELGTRNWELYPRATRSLTI